MTPETIQYLIYAGLVVGGWFIRHYNLFGLAKDANGTVVTPPPALQSSPVVPVVNKSEPTVPTVVPETVRVPTPKVGNVATPVENAISDFFVAHVKNATPEVKKAE